MCNIDIIAENKRYENKFFGEKSFVFEPHGKCLKFSLSKIALYGSNFFLK